MLRKCCQWSSRPSGLGLRALIKLVMNLNGVRGELTNLYGIRIDYNIRDDVNNKANIELRIKLNFVVLWRSVRL